MPAQPVQFVLVAQTLYGILTTDARTTVVGGTPITWYFGRRTLAQIQAFPAATLMLMNGKDEASEIPHARRADLTLRVAQFARSAILPDGTFTTDADTVVFNMLDGLLQVLQDYPSLGFELTNPLNPPPNAGLVVYHNDAFRLDGMAEADLYTSGAETLISAYLTVRP